MRWFSENTNYLLWSNCLILNIPVLYLIFVIIILIGDCFPKHSYVEIKLKSGTFQIIITLQIQLFHWRLPSRTYIKKQLSYPAIHIFICLFFQFGIKDVMKYTAILCMFLHILWQLFFPGQTLVRPSRGHGSLTCHMIQFERSDWLRSANFINSIKYVTLGKVDWWQLSWHLM